MLLPIQEGETDESPAAYRAPLRQALIDDNAGHVNVVVCEADYRALKRGIGHLPPPTAVKLGRQANLFLMRIPAGLNEAKW